MVSCEGNTQIYESKPASAPQLGQLRFLPFRNEAFEASELSLVLRDDGSMESFGYKKTRAALPAMAASAADAIVQVKAYEDARDAKRLTDLKTAREQQIAALQYQIDTINKQKDLLKAQTPPEPDAQKELKAQTVQLEAEIALLEAQLGKIEAMAALLAAQRTGQP